MKRFTTSVCLALVVAVVSYATATILHVPSEYPTIQLGINAAVDGDTVLVAPGTYVENINFLGKAIVVTSEAGAESTIIDGSAPAHPDSGSVVYFVSGEDSNSIISGFTITSGSGTYMEIYPSYSYWAYCGGGILCAGGSNPLISDNIVMENVCAYGAGIGCHYSDPRVLGNVIILNTADDHGGGLFCYHANTWLESNMIADCNTGHGRGGGVHIQWGTATIVGNTIVGNVGGLGGGIFASHYYGLIEGNHMAYNLAQARGGGIWARWSDPHIRHNIIERNVAPSDGGGIYCDGGGHSGE
ncbi:hypothetical protein AMJ39_09040 [candidate division TA06 bacterium DG_24]|uniref:Uncharacterized protein n=1 Tax=candidate division TA06 bacterium DG_24 TaxID=1703770 RepID=A0A0S7WP41_UNCT6|nr:MAG: hypothetical protein AMJ39_09040 [candidate division TA06 bacterium DG_24]